MRNPFTAPREQVRELIVTATRHFSMELRRTLLQEYSREQLWEQIDNNTGPLVDAIGEHAMRNAANSTMVEIMSSLSLSDFYFPHSETTISFELRPEISPDSVRTLDDLMEGIDSATHVDCEVQSGDETYSFQIKRYPQAHLEHANQALVNWIDTNVLQHYGDMTGTNLVIILQPTNNMSPNSLDFNTLANEVNELSDRISFDEIALSYNDGNKYFVLHKIYPEHRRVLIQLDWGLARFRGEI